MFCYRSGLELLAGGGLQWTTADLRVALVMETSTADAEWDVDTFDDFTALDEHDGAGYAAVALATPTLTADNVGLKVVLDADDTVFTALQVGTTRLKGAIIYVHNGATPIDRIPILWVDDGGFPYQPTGSDFTIVWNLNGIFSLR